MLAEVPRARPVCARMGYGPKIVKKCKGETQKAYAWALAGMSGHGSVCSLANALLALPKVHFCQRLGYDFVAAISVENCRLEIGPC
ncbi:hypothetical protein D1013_13675 [Euzebyella marina]|uniref:Uncharacterized protein n=1 Tax=Euzebyella marina TaxID=1761453 RepID=A0A3G2L848_9FLAO|nr:hypothetical protein D1013_13675 [Euzebyella marina]